MTALFDIYAASADEKLRYLQGMLNLYPERATKVVALPAAAEGAAMRRNVEMIAGELANATTLFFTFATFLGS